MIDGSGLVCKFRDWCPGITRRWPKAMRIITMAGLGLSSNLR